MRDVNFLQIFLVAAHRARRGRHASEAGFRELGEFVGILAGVDYPELAVLARQDKAPALRIVDIDIDQQPAETIQLREGLGKRIAGLPDKSDDRELRQVVGFAKMQRQRRIVREFLPRPYERNVFGQGNTVVLICHIVGPDSRTLEQRLAACAFGHGKLQQRTREPG